MTDPTFTSAFTVPATHPALPGHFPGQPLVPGVVLMERIAEAMRAWRGQRLARVVEAKFVAPLLPEQEADVLLTAAAERVRFEIRHRGTLLARGIVEGVIA